ncbi:MAG TPA: phenylalanine--tRNA ligase subunit alpha [Candidatus Babeliales bacterium]|nr:phenylalanine--tRNA ligase subunit alpha [Candidatus Babeliales bacterium]
MIITINVTGICMKDISQKIETIKQELIAALAVAIDENFLEGIRITFLGRKGKIASLMEQLKQVALEEKKSVGILLNQLKIETQERLNAHALELKNRQCIQKESIEQEFDVSAYKYSELKGTSHIYTQIITDLEDIFISMGYDIADGPEIENEYYNFTSLNIPENHPARDAQDSFFLEKEGMLLRTQCSNIQARVMKNSQPPIAVFSPGRVYRKEATDQTHDFLFTQAEVLLVDKNISMSNLLATAHTFLRKIFNNERLEIRVRPGFFPFVEPGLEIDASCPFCATGCSVCKHTRWIELLGTGMVHPNVLKAGDIDPTIYSGFAFGMGIERIAMIKYGINDIRLFHSSKIKFLNQFS